MENCGGEEKADDREKNEEAKNKRGRRERGRQTERVRETPPSRQLAGGKQAWE